MMKYFLVSCALLMLLTGCATPSHMTQPAFDQVKPCCTCPHRQTVARKIRPRTANHHHLTYWHDPKLGQHFRQQVKPHQTTPMLTDGFATVTYHSDEQPVIQTVPFHITVIRLEPGEKFTNISSGDPSRWSYAVAISGKDETAQQNILVKPSLPDISTNLVITTDKRLYNLHLVANQTATPTRNVDFWYPEDEGKEKEETPFNIDAPTDTIGYQTASPNQYRITTAGFFSRPPPWQPVRVFDEDEHTTIQFPDNIAQQDLPALFVINGGQKECVNYRFNAPYMVVDKRFNEAALVSGVGASQQAVWLTHITT